jgi:hypothetical protein
MTPALSRVSECAAHEFFDISRLSPEGASARYENSKNTVKAHCSTTGQWQSSTHISRTAEKLAKLMLAKNTL